MSSEGLRGKIIRAVGGFYFVWSFDDERIYQCRARGLFRKDGFRPLVGDNCLFRPTSAQDVEGYVESVGARKNCLIRPPVANVDQALVVFAAADPDPNLSLLDRFLIEMRREDIPTVICFNKKDLVSEARMEELCSAYDGSQNRVISASFLRGEGIEPVNALMHGRTTVLAGPSGVGKSSLTNLIFPEADMTVGAVSRRTGRGKQTTRHSQLFAAGDDTFFLDTPGFSSLELYGVSREDVKDYFPEFTAYAPQCRFRGCMHVNEPDCAVKEAVSSGEINRKRYESYVQLWHELT